MSEIARSWVPRVFLVIMACVAFLTVIVSWWVGKA